MDELRSALDQERRRFTPEPGGYARLAGRRRRRVLIRRASSAAIALLVAGAGTWFVVRAFSPLEIDRTPPRPAGRPISVQNAGELRLAWKGSTFPGDGWSVRVNMGEVLLSAPHETLDAFPASCDAASCGVAWRASGLITLGHSTSPPPVVGGMTYVASNQLAAYPLACGERAFSCYPAWTGTARPAPASMTPPAASDSRVYVGTDDGRVLAFGTSCDSPSGTCQPFWSSQADSEPIQFAPAVDGDNVYVVAQRLYDLPAACAARGPCRPRWSAPIGAFAQAPVASGGWVYLSEGDRLLAFRASCSRGGGTCKPAWTFEPHDGSFLSQPAVGNGMVYVAGARLYALPAICGEGGPACTPVWTGVISTSHSTTPPVLGDGLVFSVSSTRIVAFPEQCRSGGHTCHPAWVSPALEPALSAPGIGPTAVFVVGPSGTLYAFEIPRSPNAD
jgi:outer membrane protein assembly factor BamB